jgi:hypothetical protein
MCKTAEWRIAGNGYHRRGRWMASVPSSIPRASNRMTLLRQMLSRKEGGSGRFRSPMLRNDLVKAQRR